MTPEEARTVWEGVPLIHVPTNSPFKALCNCASSFPRHHTLAHVQKYPENYRFLTPEDLKNVKL